MHLSKKAEDIERKEKTASYYRYSCALTSLDDVFDQIVLYNTQVKAAEQSDGTRAFNLRGVSY